MVDCGETEICRKSVETRAERLAKGKESQSFMQCEFCGQLRSQVETVLPAFSSDSGLSAGATSEHADTSGLSAGSFALVQGISRADCAITHGFRESEPVPRATYITTPSKPVFFSSGLDAHVGYHGVELLSRATYLNRKKRNRETVQRHTKALKQAQRDAKRKFVAQPEISHEAAELILKNQAARTDVKFPGIIHVSHQLALLPGHENVFFCTQCGAVNAGGTPRLLKSQCDGSIWSLSSTITRSRCCASTFNAKITTSTASCEHSGSILFDLVTVLDVFFHDLIHVITHQLSQQIHRECKMNQDLLLVMDSKCMSILLIML